MESIAHIRQIDGEIQTVKEHLLKVKELTEHYGEKIGVKHIAGLAGLLHDMGKYTEAFKAYILEAVNHPNSSPKRGSVDHSTAGGKLLYDLLHRENDPFNACLAEVIGNAIISHHSYLHDFLTPELTSNYLRRVRDKELDSFERTKALFFKYVLSEDELNIYINRAKDELVEYLEREETEDFSRKLMFLTKFIFSALIDADRTNSREFEENKYAEISDLQPKVFETYYKKVMDKIHSFQISDKNENKINILRASMSDQCDDFANKPSDIYTLSIPTGGGKTLASLRYALKHAMIHDKKRIIYVVPYTTIIEQNADAVREILQDNGNILEHHSNMIQERSFNDLNNGEHDQSGINKKLKLAKDNWDSPIIFTTMVQYLNTFYAYGSRNIRRMHNLSDAIIIFDEVQKVPTNCISLFNQSLNFLKTYARSSIILCTATQPALDFVKHKLDVAPNAEIIKDIDNVIEKFQRVDIIDKGSKEQFNEAKLIEFVSHEIEKVNNLLIILNTKQTVKNLYDVLKEKYDDIEVYHLSTSMCPTHRTDILDKMKDSLIKEKKVICISTQLIEAGVDISFECVIRSLAGLDSIAQAAGRCNRHGEQTRGTVYVIDYIEENLKYLTEIKKGKQIAKSILIDIMKDSSLHGGNILSMQAMDYYFNTFYSENDLELDYQINGMNQTMIELLMAEAEQNSLFSAYVTKFNAGLPLMIKNSYQTAARKFQVINSPTTSIIVPYGEGKEIITKLNSAETIEDLSHLFQHAQRYSINVYSYQLEMLNNNNSLTTLFDNQVYALVEGAYDEEYGLNLEGDSEQALALF